MTSERWHGTAGGYTNHRCRCDPCRDAWADMCYRMRQNRTQRPTPDHVHGSANGYGNYGCRCKECTHAWAVVSREQKRRAVKRGQDTAAT
jgi:hypothetical protein